MLADDHFRQLFFQILIGCVLPVQLIFLKWFQLNLFILKMMIHEVYSEINEIKVCSCHFDLVFYAMKKFSTRHEVEDFICSVSGKI